jgi:hypothetical protein
VAFVEVDEALVRAFIVGGHDGAYPVFAPSVPTPAAWATYILPRDFVHLVDVPLTRAASVITKRGAGTRDLRAALTAASRGSDAGRAGRERVDMPRRPAQDTVP